MHSVCGPATGVAGPQLGRQTIALAVARQQSDCAARIASQREQVRKAEQKLRLLEKVKERRLAEWSRALDKEYEVLAAEGFLIRWQRGE
jgi:formylmethanofuran dehydrogenase subunit E